MDSDSSTGPLRAFVALHELLRRRRDPVYAVDGGKMQLGLRISDTCGARPSGHSLSYLSLRD